MKQTKIAILIATVMIYGSYIMAEEEHDHAKKVNDHADEHSEKAEEKTLKVGENAAMIKFSHSKSKGKVTIAVFKNDKTPLKLEKAPRLNLFINGKRKQLKTTAVADSKNKYELTNEGLKKDLNGKISLKIGDKSYKVAINPQVNGHAHGAGCNH